MQFKVTPLAECVDVLEDGSVVARFGYQSDETDDVKIPIGPLNYFAPGKEDVGQPTSFFKGRIKNVFSVTLPSSATGRWNLGDAFADANISTARCEGSTIDCIETDNQKPLGQLDQLSLRQRNNVRALVQLISASPGASRVRAQAASLVEKANALYLEQWAAIWGNFPKTSQACTGCAAIDKSGEIAEIADRSRKFLRLSRRAVALLRTARQRGLSSRAQALATNAEKLRDQVTDVSQSLPRFESQCD